LIERIAYRKSGRTPRLIAIGGGRYTYNYKVTRLHAHRRIDGERCGVLRTVDERCYATWTKCHLRETRWCAGGYRDFHQESIDTGLIAHVRAEEHQLPIMRDIRVCLAPILTRAAGTAGKSVCPCSHIAAGL